MYMGLYQETFREQTIVSRNFWTLRLDKSRFLAEQDWVSSRLCIINAYTSPPLSNNFMWKRSNLFRRNVYQRSRVKALLHYAQLWILNQSWTTSIGHEGESSSWGRSKIVSRETSKSWLHYREIHKEESRGGGERAWHTRDREHHIEYFVASVGNCLHLWLLRNFRQTTIQLHSWDYSYLEVSLSRCSMRGDSVVWLYWWYSIFRNYFVLPSFYLSIIK